MEYSSINIWDGSELELAWSRKEVSYFESNSIDISYFENMLRMTLCIMKALLSLTYIWIHIILVRSYHPCNKHWKHVEAVSIQMTFKRVIVWNRMIRWHVSLVICLNLIIYFLKLDDFWNFLFDIFIITIHLKNLPFSIYIFRYGNTVLIFFFFPDKMYNILFFFFCSFFNNVVKLNWKTIYTKYLQGCTCYRCLN